MMLTTVEKRGKSSSPDPLTTVPSKWLREVGHHFNKKRMSVHPETGADKIQSCQQRHLQQYWWTQQAMGKVRVILTSVMAAEILVCSCMAVCGEKAWLWNGKGCGWWPLCKHVIQEFNQSKISCSPLTLCRAGRIQVSGYPNRRCPSLSTYHRFWSSNCSWLWEHLSFSVEVTD